MSQMAYRPVLAEAAAHVAACEEYRAGTPGAGYRRLLAVVQVVAGNSRFFADLAEAELTLYAIDAAVPGTEPAFAHHPMCLTGSTSQLPRFGERYI